MGPSVCRHATSATMSVATHAHATDLAGCSATGQRRARIASLLLLVSAHERSNARSGSSRAGGPAPLNSSSADQPPSAGSRRQRSESCCERSSVPKNRSRYGSTAVGVAAARQRAAGIRSTITYIRSETSAYRWLSNSWEPRMPVVQRIDLHARLHRILRTVQLATVRAQRRQTGLASGPDTRNISDFFEKPEHRPPGHLFLPTSEASLRRISSRSPTATAS